MAIVKGLGELMIDGSIDISNILDEPMMMGSIAGLEIAMGLGEFGGAVVTFYTEIRLSTGEVSEKVAIINGTFRDNFQESSLIGRGNNIYIGVTDISVTTKLLFKVSPIIH